MIKLDIFSDPICPWCYIGKSFLDTALIQKPDHPFHIEWHPFQLNPEMPATGMERRAYLEAKFGGQRGAAEAYLPIVEHAEKAGLGLDLSLIKTTPNTRDSHRLIYWAGIEDCQNLVVDLLFKAYFEQGLDIASHDVLCRIAQQANLDVQAIKRLLESDQDIKAVNDKDTHHRHIGVKSVPTFIVSGQHVISGAQPSSMWSTIISELQEQLEQST